MKNSDKILLMQVIVFCMYIVGGLINGKVNQNFDVITVLFFIAYCITRTIEDKK